MIGAHAEVDTGILSAAEPTSMTMKPRDSASTKDVVNSAVRNKGPLPKFVKVWLANGFDEATKLNLSTRVPEYRVGLEEGWEEDG